MIGFIRGKLSFKHPPQLQVEVQGVGYEMEAPMTTFYDLPKIGESVILHTHLVVREDAHLLYAFTRLSERDLFRMLLKVNGVGPRVALAILSGMPADDFACCVADGDSARLTRIPGIGRKTADRLVIEMRDRKLPIDGLQDSDPSGTGKASTSEDAIRALVALGYRPADAAKAIRAVADQGLSSEEIIRQALQTFSGGSR
ncbi:MAG TPA: Holliday junction branch migration protein RuvA [Arenicellales bacterium]|jgi:Holliday junction DNA helicase RuvA|nr:Holliday junction branch migration protein RuvA [Acidiferrobacteraceae bacterium]MDP6123428.1 Holliday junction branch migration protein RuvA [Arenicellales bacterium]MDP7283989.1 Holliday junction branch migration protein RuvA [Arenicellales bacterium]MDP7521518.1 Holliday junction branch migration protein RuvA [Arenicellales bacterium]HJP26801.1 Holliday junction branch migration protein RuvA [Arenicellales bacterium]|tara:strand:- start:845 stop:1444 length:600 start_codon:yes stop_codon:yes gene_type:complete